MEKYIIAIDQGTTSTRCAVFDKQARLLAIRHKEHRQIMPRAGWVEHDALEIWNNVLDLIPECLQEASASVNEIIAVGITNQRETSVVWDKTTGLPVFNAIVWQDTRTADFMTAFEATYGTENLQKSLGLPANPYFSASKLRWILENVPGARQKAEAGTLLFGTIDTWLIWKLTEGLHITDVTNASRTFLMNIKTLAWDDDMLKAFDIPRQVLPEIRPSSEVYGEISHPVLKGVPIAGNLGDQHAALFGQCCFSPGEAKNTYGTGCFMLMNTGTEAIFSQNGLLTTLAYQLKNQPAVYALEGSVAIAGALVQWLRDQLGIIRGSEEIEELALRVEDNGGVYFVPAFSGLFAPYWRSDARGIIAGMTRFTEAGHIARAALEATAYQSADVFEAMRKDSGVTLSSLKVDGGMVRNRLLMQFQADILNIPVLRPLVDETTALGAAFAAGLAVGLWSGLDELKRSWQAREQWLPAMDARTRQGLLAGWHKAISKSVDWV